MDARGDAWDAVHEALPARGTVGQATVSDPLTRTWSVTARGPHPGRGKAPQTVTGTGEDETAALRDLDARLRGVPQPDGGRMNELRRRLRLAYVDGAESWTQENVGRGLTSSELAEVLSRYAGRVENSAPARSIFRTKRGVGRT